MQVSRDYPQPVLINGYPCRNCDEVADAKKNLDPSEAKSLATSTSKSDDRLEAVVLSGRLASLGATSAGGEAVSCFTKACGQGARVNVLA
jgi:hypothetical protein